MGELPVETADGSSPTEPEACNMLTLYGLHDCDSDPEYEEEEEDLRLYLNKAAVIKTSSYTVRTENEPEGSGSLHGSGVLRCGTVILCAAKEHPIRVKTEAFETSVTDCLTLEVEEDEEGEDEDAATRVFVSAEKNSCEYKVTRCLAPLFQPILDQVV